MTNNQDLSKSYKPLFSYYLLIFIMGSFGFSLYSLIKIMTNFISIINTAFIINVLTIPATANYIFIILSTMCDIFNYNTSRVLYNITYYSYVSTNIIAFITFLSTNSFKFFNEFYSYYCISVIIQFSICLTSIISEVLTYCFCITKNNQPEVDNDCKCVCCDELTECCISCFTKDNNEYNPLVN